jgi:hypothetical protein
LGAAAAGDSGRQGAGAYHAVNVVTELDRLGEAYLVAALAALQHRRRARPACARGTRHRARNERCRYPVARRVANHAQVALGDIADQSVYFNAGNPIPRASLAASATTRASPLQPGPAAPRRTRCVRFCVFPGGLPEDVCGSRSFLLQVPVKRTVLRLGGLQIP